jgi:hypothetical protein
MLRHHVFGNNPAPPAGGARGIDFLTFGGLEEERFIVYRSMTNSTLAVHWRFALGQALAGLRDLVHAFDFVQSAKGHTYADIKPDYLIEVIDGFLGEPDGVLFGGDRTNLQQLQSLLLGRIKPAHEHGLEAGRRCWHDGAKAFGSLTTEALHEVALRFAPDDPALRGWFAEGFCFAYSFEEMASLKKK